jgi:hypothetical protein
MSTRVYVLSSDPALAALSDYGPGWESMWQDPEGRRLLPFYDPPDGVTVLSVEEARAYRASFDPPAPYVPEDEPQEVVS